MTKKPALTHDELVSRIQSKGWEFIASDNSLPAKDRTLEDLVKLSHQRRTAGQEPGLIKEIGTEIELDLIQLEKLWQYLGLPN